MFNDIIIPTKPNHNSVKEIGGIDLDDRTLTVDMLGTLVDLPIRTIVMRSYCSYMDNMDTVMRMLPAIPTLHTIELLTFGEEGLKKTFKMVTLVDSLVPTVHAITLTDIESGCIGQHWNQDCLASLQRLQRLVAIQIPPIEYDGRLSYMHTNLEESDLAHLLKPANSVKEYWKIFLEMK